MEVEARMPRISSHSAMAIIGLSTILAASGLWNCRQYRIIERLRSQEQAAQKAEARRANAEAEQTQSTKEETSRMGHIRCAPTATLPGNQHAQPN